MARVNLEDEEIVCAEGGVGQTTEDY